MSKRPGPEGRTRSPHPADTASLGVTDRTRSWLFRDSLLAVLLLEARGAGADTTLVAAENADRTAVYALLARQTGADAAEVGKARARKIAELSPAGVWLQRDDGSWYRK